MSNLEIIRNRWQQARKVEGLQNVLTLADGSTVAGRYILTESGACTPSHNALAGFTMSEGFPTDGHGGSVNDRDYFRDRDAQQITRDIAGHYDARALQSPVVVSPDGVVLSGNGRTMAGELAARENTDASYIAHLSQFCGQYGFTAGQVGRYKHPRVLFVLRDALPYSVATFARFNAQEMKSQSKTEQAVKFGKLVKDEAFRRIIGIINAFETIADFYASSEAVGRCIDELRNGGVLSGMQLGEMYDGDSISTAGRETLENVLIGKAFAADPDAARKIACYKGVRRIVVLALGEISDNLTLGSYTLSRELSEAVGLCYTARKEGDYKEGERVSVFARQRNLFDASTVADYTDETICLFADVLNGRKETLLKKIFSVYNHQAKDAANGQTDIFCAGVRTKDEILADVRNLFATGTPKDQKEAVRASVSQRVSDCLFITAEQLTSVVAGSYVEYTCKSGDVITCKVEGVKNTIAYLSGKGCIKFWCTLSELRPTASHALSLPAWIEAGRVITDGLVSQRIAAVTGSFVIFEWLNGGYFDVSISDILQRWQLSKTGICELLEAA